MSRQVTLLKTSPDMKLGVRLSGGLGKPVKIIDTNPEGPLANLVKKNDVLESINGVPCSEGHQKAAEALRDASGELVLVLAAKRGSFFSTKRKAPPGATLQKQYSSATNLDMPKESPAEVAAPSAPVAPVTTTASAVAPTDAVAQPVAALPIKEAAPPPQKAVEMPSSPDEYSVVLQRNKTASIGMRLVQKKHTDLPFIQDIDPLGPAAKTDIMVGDILLMVNGVDARASHEELKKALGTTDAAVLKLRRVAPMTGIPTEEKAMEAAASLKQAPSAPAGGLFSFGCCASRPAGAA